MSILIDSSTKVLVQGLGKTGQFHTDKAIAYGTNMVGAVHPSRAGGTFTFEGETDHSGVPGRPDAYRVEPPISPIMITPSVSGSSSNIRSTSTKLVPLTGSPPMPTAVVWPSPSWVS